MRPEDPRDSPVDEAANSIAPIGKYSLDIRPSHSTTASVLLVVMRKTTPRRPVQTDLPPRLLLNAAAARAVSFTLSPCLINFSLSVSPSEYLARTAAPATFTGLADHSLIGLDRETLLSGPPRAFALSSTE